MKTIFISSFHPLISRNILSTEILPQLLNKGIRVVLPTPHYKREYFESAFGGLPGLYIEGVMYNKPSGSLVGRFFKRSFHALLGVRNVEIYYRRRVLGQRNFLYSFAFKSLNYLGRLRVVMNLARFVFLRLSPNGFFDELLDRYKPDLIVITDLHNENDVALMQDARRRGIPIVGSVRSWDHLTSKGLLKIVPDFIFSPNEVVKDDAIRFHGVSVNRIKVIGIPHYDRYFGYSASCSREEFAFKLGIDPKKKIVLYAPYGSRYTSNNTVDRDVIELTSAALPSTHMMLVRFPPTDSVDIEGFALPRNVVVYRPGVHLSSKSTKFIRNEMTLADDEILRDTLYFSDLVISGPSTISIDAAIFGKPVIIAAFDGKENKPYDQSVRRYFEYDYFQSLLSSGGVRLAENADDFIKFIALYIKNSHQDADGRERIVKKQCSFTDGKSSDRFCKLIYEILGV